MVKKEWYEVPILIHGVSPLENPKEHSKSYTRILELINKNLIKNRKKPFTKKSINIEWGWESGMSNENDRYLSEAQRIIHDKIITASKKKSSYFPNNLLNKLSAKLRKELFFGAGDFFYYLSPDGEDAVRNNVFNQISKSIIKEKNKNISLTFITHSAGTVIMHDLLYHIFGRKGESPIKSINNIRKLVKEGKLRVRRVFTFGSPITSASFRTKTLLMNIINGKKLNPESIGLRKSDNLSNPRWVNFWDKDDILSFPLEFSYKKAKNEKIVVDEIINLKGFLFWKVHGRYWRSNKMAKKIAEFY